jgi:hypothetical protein
MRLLPPLWDMVCQNTQQTMLPKGIFIGSPTPIITVTEDVCRTTSILRSRRAHHYANAPAIGARALTIAPNRTSMSNPSETPLLRTHHNLGSRFAFRMMEIDSAWKRG